MPWASGKRYQAIIIIEDRETETERQMKGDLCGYSWASGQRYQAIIIEETEREKEIQ